MTGCAQHGGEARSIVGWRGSGLSADQIRSHKQANYADNYSDNYDPLEFFNERQPRFHFGQFMMQAHISFSRGRCVFFAHLRFQQSLIQCFVNCGHYPSSRQMLSLSQIIFSHLPKQSEFPLQPDPATGSSLFFDTLP